MHRGPTGILFHGYELDTDGTILDAGIVPPTSQNQKTIEQDLYHVVAQSLALPQDQLTWRCEQAIRTYDRVFRAHTFFAPASGLGGSMTGSVSSLPRQPRALSSAWAMATVVMMRWD